MHKHTKIYYFIDQFDSNEIKKLDKNIAIIYRNYNNQLDLSLIRQIKECCATQNRKFFISNNLKIAKNLKLDGVYIPSFNRLNNFHNLNVKKGFTIIGSAHNLFELKNKENQGCSSIFISPLFKNKKSKFFLDVNRFNLLSQNSISKIVALGGINSSNISKLKKVNCKAFASISWIKKNRPKLIGRFL